ncbi:uncharacterized protein KY384_005796 [Bacidia gigantensis]|uniref:uncharacterized protein n=1 Tax=Bacidia gigantensis TaxID=2732470 RepID=UPI001D044F22|nr:uncharacterized protein KY384_005796 [Bacidia gigantensis]KAG8529161.1 hypothetical protein KY384_005796 [Bacidia gigantensis]
MAALCTSKRLAGPLTQAANIFHLPGETTRRCFSTTPYHRATLGLDQLDQTRGNRERVVILGSGWAGYVLSQRLSSQYQTLVISPRNYFVFTPLLNSAAVGTLEFRLALEPVRSHRTPNIEYMQGWADTLSVNRKTITIEESVVDQRKGRSSTDADPYRHSSLTALKLEKFGKRREGKRFEVGYDKLVVAVGAYSQTFGTPGVKENAYFMKDVGDARRIRKRVLECFEMASLPTTPEKLREQLLRFAIIGGGPTGMEFAAELSDLVQVTLAKVYPRLVPMVRITVHDVARKVLNMFDEKLAAYAMRTFSRQGVSIKTESSILELRSGQPKGNGAGKGGGSGVDEELADAQGLYTLVTKEGEEGVGMCVWSTGNMINPFVKSALRKQRRFPNSSAMVSEGRNPGELPSHDWMLASHPKTGGLLVDDHLRMQLHSQTTTSTKDGQEKPATKAALTDVYALGDNASVDGMFLPATAQTASQQAEYLAKCFNEEARERSTPGFLHSSSGGYEMANVRSGLAQSTNGVVPTAAAKTKPFKFNNLGIMAYVGDSKAIVDSGGENTPDLSGRAAWLVWRGAYMVKSISWRNRVLIPTYW